VELSDVGTKNCRELRYSNGGHFLAGVAGNLIQIFSPIQYELLAVLKGHVGMIKSICWSQDDKKLYSASVDGILYTWSMEVVSIATRSNFRLLTEWTKALRKECSTLVLPIQ
jgi:WD40 repeat protein